MTLPFQLRRRGVEAKLIVGNEIANPTVDPKLEETIRNANRWLKLLTTGEATSVDAIAELDGLPASEISRVLPLAFLAPDITKAILTGKQPVDLTAERLKRIGKLPACWNEQRRVLEDAELVLLPQTLELPLPATGPGGSNLLVVEIGQQRLRRVFAAIRAPLFKSHRQKVSQRLR